MNPSARSVAQPPRALHYTIAMVWWALLAGLLIFNRPFATLGFPPIYISELGIALVFALACVHPVGNFVEPLKQSWAFRFVAAFLLYGVARSFWDARTLGFIALRDG